MSDSTRGPAWPDSLSTPAPGAVNQLLISFWHQLLYFSDLLSDERRQTASAGPTANGDENLLAVECLAALRAIVVEMMLALNGITRPADTIHLNTYLSENQRAALERTLLAPQISAETWVGQAVSLVVIYRWYAPSVDEAVQYCLSG
jgi:hypothetical protein